MNDDDRWAMVRTLARSLVNADLEDFASVVQAAYEAGFSSREFMPALDEAINLAREARGR